jgi:hypothetical protein
VIPEGGVGESIEDPCSSGVSPEFLMREREKRTEKIAKGRKIIKRIYFL